MSNPVHSIKKQCIAGINPITPIAPHMNHAYLQEGHFFKPIQESSIFIDDFYGLVSSTTTPIIKWSDDGSKVIITDIKSFTDYIMPVYFARAKFSSFRRRLTSYDFTRPDWTEKKTWLFSAILYFNVSNQSYEKVSLVNKESVPAFQRLRHQLIRTPPSYHRYPSTQV